MAYEVLHVIIVICKVDVQPTARWSENQASLTKGICLTSGKVWCSLAHMWSSNSPPKCDANGWRKAKPLLCMKATSPTAWLVSSWGMLGSSLLM